MDDRLAALNRLLADAEDCTVIGNLASDRATRARFRKIAADYRARAERLKIVLAGEGTKT